MAYSQTTDADSSTLVGTTLASGPAPVLAPAYDEESMTYSQSDASTSTLVRNSLATGPAPGLALANDEESMTYSQSDASSSTLVGTSLAGEERGKPPLAPASSAPDSVSL